MRLPVRLLRLGRGLLLLIEEDEVELCVAC